MDIIDRANDYAVRLNDAALARHASLTQSARPTQALVNARTGRRVCLDCYEPIPKKRLKANPHAIRCTECQTDHERRYP